MAIVNRTVVLLNCYSNRNAKLQNYYKTTKIIHGFLPLN